MTSQSEQPYAVFSLLYNKLLEMQDEFDIIHDHCEWLQQALKTPYRYNIAPSSLLTRKLLFSTKSFLILITLLFQKNQKKIGPGINIVRTIYHGFPLDKYEFNSKPKDYLLWLSKITPQKGPADTTEVTKASGQKLIISGYILPNTEIILIVG